MNDGLSGEDPEKALGCVVEVLVVGSSVQFPRREDGQKVCESNAKEDAEVYELFVFLANTKLLLEIAGICCETSGKFRVRKATSR